MQTGFWNDFDRSVEHCWSYLEHWEIDNPEWEFGPYNYLHGMCDAFAQVLNIKFRYPIWYLMSGESLVHAFCVTDQNVYVDIRGKQSDFGQFLEEFEVEPWEIGPDGDFWLARCDRPLARYSFNEKSQYIMEAKRLVYLNRDFYA